MPGDSKDAPSHDATVGAVPSDGPAAQPPPGVPLLPPPDPSSGDSSNGNIPKIKLGDTISLEALGPVIINADGTTRRIENWDQMTEGERQVAWRRISQRNEERRRKLLLQQQQTESGDSHKDDSN